MAELPPVPGSPFPAHTVVPFVLPPGLPPADPSAPKLGMTQEQIDAMVTFVSGFWPAFKKLWPVLLPAFVAIAALAGGAGRVTAPTVAPDTKPPVIVNVAPTPTPTPAPAPTPTPVKPAAHGTLTIYPVAGIDAKAAALALKDLAATIKVDGHVWPAGSVYPFKGKSIPLPCMALADSSGAVLDVAPFVQATAAADAAAMLKGTP